MASRKQKQTPELSAAQLKAVRGRLREVLAPHALAAVRAHIKADPEGWADGQSPALEVILASHLHETIPEADLPDGTTWADHYKAALEAAVA